MPACELCHGFSWSRDMRIIDGKVCCRSCYSQLRGVDSKSPKAFIGMYISDQEVDFAIGIGNLNVEYKNSMDNIKANFKKKPKIEEVKDGMDMRDIQEQTGAMQEVPTA